MKSSIKIDLGPMNNPIIDVHAILTDDVRDRLVWQFKEQLGYMSNLAFIDFHPAPSQGTVNFSLQAIPPAADMFIDRLTIAQCKDIIPLAFRVLGEEDQLQVLEKIGILAEPASDGKLLFRHV